MENKTKIRVEVEYKGKTLGGFLHNDKLIIVDESLEADLLKYGELLHKHGLTSLFISKE